MNEEKASGDWKRKLLEAMAWIFSAGLLWTLDTLSKLTEREQAGVSVDVFRLITEQVTSAAAALIMVLFVIRWLRLFPIRKDALVPAIIGHTVGTMVFAFGHYSLMVLFRGIIYGLNDMSYTWREPFVANLIVEYQKDIKIYVAIVIVISVYQHFRRPRVQAAALTHGGRLVVQTGLGESVLRFEQIDYLEAARNYVVVHANNKEYLVRETMSSLEKRLAGGPFARTHRSFVVNVDEIEEIRTIDSKQRIRLKNGSEIPLSRGYRHAFKAHLTA